MNDRAVSFHLVVTNDPDSYRKTGFVAKRPCVPLIAQPFHTVDIDETVTLTPRVLEWLDVSVAQRLEAGFFWMKADGEEILNGFSRFHWNVIDRLSEHAEELKGKLEVAYEALEAAYEHGR